MRAPALRTLAIGCAVVLASCAAPAATGTPDDEAAIRRLVTNYADAWNRGDAAALAAMVSPDYQAVEADGKVVMGRSEMQAMEKDSATRRAGMGLALTVNTSFLKFTSANSAAAGGTWTMAGVPAGTGAADKGAWNGTFVKGDDGSWLMLTGLVSEYHPEPTPAAMPEAGKGK
jgi:uncharacterized protein (TIGR02246 family)